MDTDSSGKKFSLKLDSNSMFRTIFVILLLFAVMKITAYARMSTLDYPTVLDYDPWWWYRHAEDILENGFVIPKWDELSHFPPGRPVEAFHGWSYTLALMYKLFNPLIGWTLTDVAKWSTVIFAALAAIPAFMLGRKASNDIGGLMTSIFGTLTPGLVAVSMAGYCDTDMVVVFYSFLSVYSILMLMKRKLSIKNLPYYLFAILVNLAFVFTWGFGWMIMLFFIAFVPAMFIFKAVEQVIHKRKFEISISELTKEFDVVFPILVVILVTNVFGTLLGLGNILDITGLGISFVQGNLLNVNVSVAELQQIDVFSRSGFDMLVGRVGLAPVLFTIGIWPLPVITSPLMLFMLFRIYKKIKIDPEEIFLFIWAIITFVLILRGVRFSLLFGTASAVTTGYLIGKIPKYINKEFFKVTFYGVVMVLVLVFISNSIYSGSLAGDSLRISDNWYNMLDWLKENVSDKSLIVTWWDPGHIIAGYTGLRVHADGAHCGEGVMGCIPYGHNDRIADMGKVFSISDENEAVKTLEKYKGLTDDQCQELIADYGEIFPIEACEPVPEMYVIASSDLIQKYYWLSYFGTGEGKSYIQFSISNYENNVLYYGDGQVALVDNGGTWLPVINYPEQGIRNVPVSEIVYYENGKLVHVVLNETEVINGLVWVDPSYNSILFMGPELKDSIFTRMFFFDGEGLEHFNLVYQNSEIKVFKVIW